MLKLNRGILAVPFVFFISASINTLTLSTAWAVSDEVALQLLERLSELEREVSNLRGENETLRRELMTLRSAQRTGFLEVDRRVRTLEKTRPPGQAQVPTSNSISNQNSAADTANPVPALEAPVNVASTALATPNSVVARPSPITVTPAAPAVEVGAAASGETAIQSGAEGNAAQRRAVVPVNTATATTAEPEKVDPNSPESYYYYGTQDKNAAGVSGVTGTENAGVTVSRQQAIPDTHKPKAAYNQAYKLLVNNPASAVPAFRAFITDYPQHELVANAQYWLGEALYAQKDYSGATEEFMQVLKNHKGSPKAPGAALKLGYSFYELRQWDFARRTLEDTVRFFPDTNAAKLATNRLERMATEGR